MAKSKKYKIEFDKIYEFDLTGKVQFGDLPEQEVYDLYKDGRVASKFLEHTVPLWFPELTFVDKRGYDHIDNKEVKYDLKGFTRKSGARYAPSNMIGGNRKIDYAVLKEHAEVTNYIFSDITEFPKVRIIFKTGEQMLNEFPSGDVKYKQREQLFGKQ